jgi:hypothetical protein
MIFKRELFWVTSLLVISIAVILRLRDGSAGIFALLIIPATIFVMADATRILSTIKRDEL